MSISVGVTRICLFDLHLSPATPRSAAHYRPDLQFLADPAAYEAKHAQQWSLDRGRFRFRPLGRQLQWNHFWTGVANLCAVEGAATPNPRFQLPLRCRPTDAALSVALPAPFGITPVRARLLVWPWGWSTQVEVTLSRPSDLPELVEARAALQRDSIFTLRLGAGAPVRSGLSLSQVFAALTDALRADLFAGPVGVKRIFPRRAVVSLAGFPESATPFTYRANVEPGVPVLPTADRARLHGILLGDVVEPADLLARENAGRFFLTPIAKTGFTVTYLEHGTLLVLHEAAPRSGHVAAAARCLWRNTVLFQTATAAWRGFGRMPRGMGDWLEASADWAAVLLEHLPEYYDNRLGRKTLALS